MLGEICSLLGQQLSFAKSAFPTQLSQLSASQHVTVPNSCNIEMSSRRITKWKDRLRGRKDDSVEGTQQDQAMAVLPFRSPQPEITRPEISSRAEPLVKVDEGEVEKEKVTKSRVSARSKLTFARMHQSTPPACGIEPTTVFEPKTRSWSLSTRISYPRASPVTPTHR